MLTTAGRTRRTMSRKLVSSRGTGAGARIGDWPTETEPVRKAPAAKPIARQPDTSNNRDGTFMATSSVNAPIVSWDDETRGNYALLKVQRRAERRVPCGFAECFTERWMRVAEASNVLGTAGILHHGDRFGDHVGSARAENVNAQQAVGLGIRQDLDRSLGLIQTFGATARDKWKLANLILSLGLFELFLRQADAGKFRPGIDDARDGVVIDERLVPGQHLGERLTFDLRFVSEHRTVDHVAQRVNPVRARSQRFHIDRDF